MSQADRDRPQYYSRKVKIFKFVSEKSIRVHPSTYLRIGELCSSTLFPSLRHLSYEFSYLCEMSNFQIFLHLGSPLLDSLKLIDITDLENTLVGPFLASLSSQMLRHIVLSNGELSGDIFKQSIIHFMQLRSIELLDAVSMEKFVFWEVLGTLPSMDDVTLLHTNPNLYPVRENSNNRSGGSRYFEALKNLRVTSSFFIIQHLLSFIDSPCLESIKIYPAIHQLRPGDGLEPEDLFTPSMTIVSSKWSQSLLSQAHLLVTRNAIQFRNA